jgi:hypothetical protein
MKYPEFFAILSDQCYRFAPDVVVPKPFADVLTELRSSVALSDIDKDLLKAFNDTLPHVLSEALDKAHTTATEAVVSRLGDLHQERANTLAVAREKADEANKVAAKHKELLEGVGEWQARIEDLEKKILNLTQKRT